ncbi:hypothetical protein MIMGU_mgv1a017366mg [Erythranthe guttata]|uniref:Uncharacterized protein n=1 Tax=Erythranthe guttata TaxID=4155 RepID=A0A022PT05_ERYGU|nr:hypothetical protein MIMGU_mgv1a017366mg [Erythranthe guttata]
MLQYPIQKIDLSTSFRDCTQPLKNFSTRLNFTIYHSPASSLLKKSKTHRPARHLKHSLYQNYSPLCRKLSSHLSYNKMV